MSLGVAVGTAIILIAATQFQNTEFPGSEKEVTLEAMASIAAYGVVMLGVCLLGCLAPIRRALGIEPTIALRTE